MFFWGLSFFVGPSLTHNHWCCTLKLSICCCLWARQPITCYHSYLLHPENHTDVEKRLKAIKDLRNSSGYSHRHFTSNLSMSFQGSNISTLGSRSTRKFSTLNIPSEPVVSCPKRPWALAWPHSSHTSKRKATYSWPCSAQRRLDKYWLKEMCYVMTHCLFC